MGAYILRRLLLIIPTMFGIMAVSFAIIQFAPGGPVEQMIAQLTGTNVDATARIGGGSSDFGAGNPQGGGDSGSAGKYRGSQGLDPEFIKSLEKQFGFDKPWYTRFSTMMWNYLRFDFGDSYFRDVSVISLIKEKLPVSVSLGLWMTLISYGISIPLGIKKAVSDGSRFDAWTSSVIIIGYAIPGFLFAVLLIVLFAGGSFFNWFPSRGLTSDNWQDLSWLGLFGQYLKLAALPIVIAGLSGLYFLTKRANTSLWQAIRTSILFSMLLLFGVFVLVAWLNLLPDSGEMTYFGRVGDYFWHLVLPLIAMSLSAFATTTFLTKNSFLDEIKKQYVVTARAKGLTENQVLYGHVFRNAMLIIIAGFPGAFIGAFFTGSLLIETIFSLDGLGLLSFKSILDRDYPVVFANLYIFSLVGIIVGLISDLTYTWIDPRIDFESREI